MSFSLLGGPLHRLGCHLRLVRKETNTVPIGLMIGGLLWIILVVLAFISGANQRLFSLPVIAAHVRLLVAIPLFFLAESWLAPRWTTFVSMIASSGVVPRKELPALDFEVTRTSRWKDSWLPEAVCLLAAVLLSIFGSRLPLHGATTAYDASRAATDVTAAGLWYWIVCMTIFRFLILRWIWRLCLWSYFLLRVAKLKLHLMPTHPDGTAGLGYLQVVHMHFTPLVLAISMVECASFAEEISSGTMAFEAIYPAFALVLLVDAFLFLGPLFIFTPKLWACEVKGRRDYMNFAQNYVSDFDRKWLGDRAPDEPLLGTQDLQALADLSNSVNVIRQMRWVPVGKSLLLSLGVAALAPALPLLLMKYPITDLAQKFFTRLTGL